MEPEALLAAWLRALPLALCLPLPGLSPRLALGIVLGLVGVGAPSGALRPEQLPVELAVGLALGLGVTAPIWAARWAGGVIGFSVGQLERPLASLYTVLAWISFLAAGGANLVAAAYASSYLRWPPGAPLHPGEGLAHAGSELASLAARLALPSLLAIAMVELTGGLLARFERSARLPAGAQPLARGARPLVAMLFVVASLAALSQSLGAATRAAAASSNSR